MLKHAFLQVISLQCKTIKLRPSCRRQCEGCEVLEETDDT